MDNAPKKPAAVFPVHSLENFSINSNKTIFVTAPDDFDVDYVMKKISSLLNNISYRKFPSREAAEHEYVKNPRAVAAGIVFGYQKETRQRFSFSSQEEDHSGRENDYAIRMADWESVSSKRLFTDDQGSCREMDNTAGTGTSQCEANKYLVSGQAHLQTIIDKVLIERETLASLPPVSAFVQMMPKEEFQSSMEYLRSLLSYLAIYVSFGYTPVIKFLAVHLVAEKEKNVREGMFMMGLRNSVFWLSWILPYLVLIIVTSAMLTGLAKLVRFFDNSNSFLLFSMLNLYGTSVIALACLMPLFFKKTPVAGRVAPLIYIFISLLYLLVSRTYTWSKPLSSIPVAIVWTMCLLSPVALDLAVDDVILLNSAGIGLNFDTWTTGHFSFLASLSMLCLDTALYLFLAVYLDTVLPSRWSEKLAVIGEIGQRCNPLTFLGQFCQRQKRASRKTNLDFSDRLHDSIFGPSIEPIPDVVSDKGILRCLNIYKAFKDKDEIITAVNDFSMDMYEGQITALLGHGGAGKTTLINMLTGAMAPTSGTATIYGLDITCKRDMQEIRSMCGICLQDNSLYDELTAVEHLKIFAGIKGVPPDKLDLEVKKAIQNVDLTEHGDMRVSKLSGTQKRKLVVALALIGDPKILFLDEPTVGMDPYSQQHTWSLLRSSKEGKVIVLTTDFMNEADILADRKAFINKGRLMCVGSSLYLKNKSNIGYHLNLLGEPDFDGLVVLNFLQKYVDGVRFKRADNSQLTYTIPLAEVSNFADLFQALEAREDNKETRAKSFGILKYNVTLPSLEEVVLKQGRVVICHQTDTLGPRQVPVTNIDDSYKPKPILRSDQASRRSMIGKVPVVRKQENPGWTVFMILLKMRLKLFWRSPTTLYFTLCLVAVGIILGRWAPSFGDKSAFGLKAEMYAPTQSSLSSLPNFLLFDAVDNNASETFIKTLNDSYRVDKYTAGLMSISHVKPHYIGINITGAESAFITNFTALYNDSAIHSLPAILTAVSAAIFHISTAATRTPVESYIHTYIFPWPDVERKMNNKAFFLTFFVGTAFSAMAASLGTAVVYDKEFKCKNQLRLSGVNFRMYWVTTFLHGVLILLIPAITLIVLAFLFQIPCLTETGAAVMLLLLVITFIPANLLFSFNFSFLFKHFKMAWVFLPCIFILVSTFQYTIVSLTDVFVSSEDVGVILHLAFLVINPLYNIFGGLYFIAKVYKQAVLDGRVISTGDYFAFENNILVCIIMNVVDTVLGCCVLAMLDVWRPGGTFWKADSIKDSAKDRLSSIFKKDDGVSRERARVDTMDEEGSEEDTMAYVRELRKEFTKPGIHSIKTKIKIKKGDSENSKEGSEKQEKHAKKVAVNNLSFAVERGEVFGLLGPIGAGKTTVLSMMTGEVQATRGKVVVDNHKVSSSMSVALKNVGFCPQKDALWGKMTVEEHLEIYATLKGVHTDDIKIIIDYFIENLRMMDHRNKKAKELSGGNRRKLSCAMSMLGGPSVLLLDEPSAGMDPKAKRSLWDIVSNSYGSEDRGVILATSSIDEAEALCSRVAIIVNGQIECLGTIQQIKEKYTSDYLLEIILGVSSESLEARVERLEKYLVRRFPSAVCLDSFAEYLHYKIPKDDLGLLSTAYEALENMKECFGVEEYSFGQPTLHQIYLNLAKEQILEGEDAENLAKKQERRMGRRLTAGDSSTEIW